MARFGLVPLAVDRTPRWVVVDTTTMRLVDGLYPSAETAAIAATYFEQLGRVPVGLPPLTAETLRLTFPSDKEAHRGR